MAFVKFKVNRTGDEYETVSYLGLHSFISARSHVDEDGERVFANNAYNGKRYFHRNNGSFLGYLIEDVPFETTLQLVGIEKNRFLLQDLEPNEEHHIGYTPIYTVTPVYMVPMLQVFGMHNERMQGRFQFRGHGNSASLTLAEGVL